MDEAGRDKLRIVQKIEIRKRIVDGDTHGNQPHPDEAHQPGGKQQIRHFIVFISFLYQNIHLSLLKRDCHNVLCNPFVFISSNVSENVFFHALVISHQYGICLLTEGLSSLFR